MAHRPYQEKSSSTVTHHGKQYRLNTLLRLAHKRLNRALSIDKLDWILDHSTPDPERVEAADLKVPILVFYDETIDNGRWVVIDGLHRLARACREDRKMLDTKFVVQADLDRALISQRS